MPVVLVTFQVLVLSQRASHFNIVDASILQRITAQSHLLKIWCQCFLERHEGHQLVSLYNCFLCIKVDFRDVKLARSTRCDARVYLLIRLERTVYIQRDLVHICRELLGDASASDQGMQVQSLEALLQWNSLAWVYDFHLQRSFQRFV